MKLNFKFILLTTVLLNLFLQPQAVWCQEENENLINEKIASVGFDKYFKKDSEVEIKEFFANIDKYIQNNNYKKLKTVLSKNFVNNDGFDYSLFLKSLKDGGDLYTNRKSDTKILDYNVLENYATVHVIESGEAVSVKDSKDNLGKSIILLKSEVYYTLCRENGKWKILSANTVDENFLILYGCAKSMYFSLNAPMNVKADSEYTATLSFQPQNGFVYVSSISQEPIIYPVPKTKDIFKPVKPDGILERIFTSNKSDYNEYVIASIGITKPEMASNSDFNINLVGSAYVIKRVNVLDAKKFEKNNSDKK